MFALQNIVGHPLYSDLESQEKVELVHYIVPGVMIPESFQLQMGFSFPFLRANNLRLYLLIIRAHSFLLSCM